MLFLYNITLTPDGSTIEFHYCRLKSKRKKIIHQFNCKIYTFNHYKFLSSIADTQRNIPSMDQIFFEFASFLGTLGKIQISQRPTGNLGTACLNVYWKDFDKIKGPDRGKVSINCAQCCVSGSGGSTISQSVVLNGCDNLFCTVFAENYMKIKGLYLGAVYGECKLNKVGHLINVFLFI